MAATVQKRPEPKTVYHCPQCDGTHEYGFGCAEADLQKALAAERERVRQIQERHVVELSAAVERAEKAEVQTERRKAVTSVALEAARQQEARAEAAEDERDMSDKLLHDGAEIAKARYAELDAEIAKAEAAAEVAEAEFEAEKKLNVQLISGGYRVETDRDKLRDRIARAIEVLEDKGKLLRGVAAGEAWHILCGEEIGK